jgi:hypothetical protein
MPTAREVLYALFILICIVLVGWIFLEALDRLDDEAFIRLLIGG